MRYTTITLERLYLGYIADVRDYIWQEAKRKKRGLKFHIKPTDRWITIPYQKLDEGEVGERVFQSKVLRSPHKTYRLVSFSVTPDMIKEQESKSKPKQEQLSVEGAIATMPQKYKDDLRRRLGL